MTDEQYKAARQDAAVVQMRRFIELLLQDLEYVHRTSWGAVEERSAADRAQLEYALKLKLQSYRQLLDVHLTPFTDQDPLVLLRDQIMKIATMPPGLAADLQKHTALAPLPQEESPEPCTYCDGVGGSPFTHGGEEHIIPCIACNGTGKQL